MMDKNQFFHLYLFHKPLTDIAIVDEAYTRFEELKQNEIKEQNITTSLKRNQPHIYNGMIANIENKCFAQILSENK